MQRARGSFAPWGRQSLAAVLVALYKRGPVRAFIILAAVFFVPTLALSALQHTALPDGTPFVTFFEDFSTVADFLLLCPLALVLAGACYVQASAAVESLRSNGVLLTAARDASSQIARFNALLESRVVAAVPVVIGVSAMLLNGWVRSAYTHDYALNGVHSLTGWYVVLVTSMFMAAMFELAFRIGASGVLVSRLVSPGVRPSPVSSDRCGGFAAIGHMAFLLSYVVLIEFATVSLMLLMDVLYFGRSSSFRVVGLGSAVLVLSPIVFLWLVLPVHRAMLRAKQSILRRLDGESRALGSELASLLEVDGALAGSTATSALITSYESLRTLHALADDAPAWPVTRVATASYFATLLASLLVSLAANTLTATAGTLVRQISAVVR